MGGGGSYSKSNASSSNQMQLLPEQKKIWEFLTAQAIPMALGKETLGTKIGAQRARDEGANIAGLQQAQINQMATRGFGSAQRARLMSQSQQNALQSTMQNVLQQRQASQNQGFSMLSGLPIAPGSQGKSKSSSMSVSAKGGAAG